MRKIVCIDCFPNNSIICEGFGRIDYFDSYRLTKTIDRNIEQITGDLFHLPVWVNWLMNLRNSIVWFFGLKTEKDRSKDQDFYFSVINRNGNEIVMSEDDKHLNFRTSIMIDIENSFVYLTTLVQFHNIGGQFYFFLIKPFHQLIMKQLLKRL